VWGASGGLGSMAVQLIATSGANAIGVVSEDDKRDFVMQLGARGVINRKKFNCWGELPKVGTPEYDAWFKEARKFGAAIWEITGKGNNVDFVFEHPGAATFPVSVLVRVGVTRRFEARIGSDGLVSRLGTERLQGIGNTQLSAKIRLAGGAEEPYLSVMPVVTFGTAYAIAPVAVCGDGVKSITTPTTVTLTRSSGFTAGEVLHVMCGGF